MELVDVLGMWYVLSFLMSYFASNKGRKCFICSHSFSCCRVTHWNHSPLQTTTPQQTFRGFPLCHVLWLNLLTTHFPLYSTSLQFTLFHVHLSPSCLFKPWVLKILFTPSFYLQFDFLLFLVPFIFDTHNLFVVLSSLIVSISKPFQHSLFSSPNYTFFFYYRTSFLSSHYLISQPLSHHILSSDISYPTHSPLQCMLCIHTIPVGLLYLHISFLPSQVVTSFTHSSVLFLHNLLLPVRTH